MEDLNLIELVFREIYRTKNANDTNIEKMNIFFFLKIFKDKYKLDCEEIQSSSWDLIQSDLEKLAASSQRKANKAISTETLSSKDKKASESFLKGNVDANNK